jgi:hypothetical protein
MLSIISSHPSGSNRLFQRWWISDELIDLLANLYNIVYTDQNGKNSIGTDSQNRMKNQTPIFVTGATGIGYHVKIDNDTSLTLYQMNIGENIECVEMQIYH